MMAMTGGGAVKTVSQRIASRLCLAALCARTGALGGIAPVCRNLPLGGHVSFLQTVRLHGRDRVDSRRDNFAFNDLVQLAATQRLAETKQVALKALQGRAV